MDEPVDKWSVTAYATLLLAIYVISRGATFILLLMHGFVIDVSRAK